MAPSTQTRVVVTAFNPADPTSTLRVETDAPVPTLKEGEVLMRVLARPINPADVFSIMVRAHASPQSRRARVRVRAQCARRV